MKSCSTCHRTYSDETITFCLVDGSILSAPFAPEATQPLGAARLTNPPPTEILPYSEAVPPTIRSPFPLNPPTPKPAPHQLGEFSPDQKSGTFKMFTRRFLLGILFGAPAGLIIGLVGNQLILEGRHRADAAFGGLIFGAILGAIILPISKVRFIKRTFLDLLIGAPIGLTIALIGNQLILGGRQRADAGLGGILFGAILGAIILPVIRYARK
jgi:hypothetical protein